MFVDIAVGDPCKLTSLSKLPNEYTACEKQYVDGNDEDRWSSIVGQNTSQASPNDCVMKQKDALVELFSQTD